MSLIWCDLLKVANRHPQAVDMLWRRRAGSERAGGRGGGLSSVCVSHIRQCGPVALGSRVDASCLRLLLRVWGFARKPFRMADSLESSSRAKVKLTPLWGEIETGERGGYLTHCSQPCRPHLWLGFCVASFGRETGWVVFFCCLHAFFLGGACFADPKKKPSGGCLGQEVCLGFISLMAR